jgi:DNA-binding transcriptional ArsR family regulator
MVTEHLGTTEVESDRADGLFHALADPTRRDIVRLVLDDEHSVSDLARRYPMSFAAVHKHVSVLERAGLVSKRRRGREQMVSGETAGLETAGRLLDQYEAIWRDRVDRMDALLDDTKSNDQTAAFAPKRQTTTEESP